MIRIRIRIWIQIRNFSELSTTLDSGHSCSPTENTYNNVIVYQLLVAHSFDLCCSVGTFTKLVDFSDRPFFFLLRFFLGGGG